MNYAGKKSKSPQGGEEGGRVSSGIRRKWKYKPAVSGQGRTKKRGLSGSVNRLIG